MNLNPRGLARSRFPRSVLVIATALLAFVAFSSVALRPASANNLNLLSNGSFEMVGPHGPFTSFTGTGPGPAAVANWEVFKNSAGMTTTDLLPTKMPNAGQRMIQVTTDGADNARYRSSPPSAAACSMPTSRFGCSWCAAA
jgi:hypothetical protein